MSTSKYERCEQCKKKMGLISFVCKCQKKFCSGCLQPDLHHCSIDYKAIQQDIIRKNNPMITTEKMIKI